MKRKPLKEIAKELNVSPSAISLVLHGNKGVGKELRSRIISTLIENGYSLSGNSLEKGGTVCFIKYAKHGMLVNGNPGFVNSLIDAIEYETSIRNLSFQLINCNDTNLPSVLEEINNEHHLGAIFLGTELDQSGISALDTLDIPYVLVDCRMMSHACASVTMDNHSATYEAIKHLVDLGHRNIGFLANSMPGDNCLNRLYTFRKTMEELLLPYSIFSIDPTMEGAYGSVKDLIAKGESFPSALVANNDSIALGAIKAFREAGIRIPEDISIIGFDDISYAAISDPPLTTLKVSLSTIGYHTVNLLCDRIKKPLLPLVKIQVCPKLVIRGSTARFSE